jgi:hypothetical protein
MPRSMCDDAKTPAARSFYAGACGLLLRLRAAFDSTCGAVVSGIIRRFVGMHTLGTDNQIFGRQSQDVPSGLR